MTQSILHLIKQQVNTGLVTKERIFFDLSPSLDAVTSHKRIFEENFIKQLTTQYFKGQN